MENKVTYITLEREEYPLSSVTRALPGYFVEADLNSDRKLIKSGETKPFYAVIDTDEAIIVPYSKNIEVIEGTNKLIATNSCTSLKGVKDFNNNEILPQMFDDISIYGEYVVTTLSNQNHMKDEFPKLYRLYSMEGKQMLPEDFMEINFVRDGIFKVVNFETYGIWFSNTNSIVSTPRGAISNVWDCCLLIKAEASCGEYQWYYRHHSGYMLLSMDGRILSPLSTHEIGEFNREGYADISIMGPNQKLLRGVIGLSGTLYFRRDDELITMRNHEYDWICNFNGEITDALMSGQIVHLNKQFEKMVRLTINDQSLYIKLPEDYTYGYDSNVQYIKVVKGGLMGIIDCEGKEIVPPKYSHVDIIERNEGELKFASHSGLSFLNEKGERRNDKRSEQTRFVCYLPGLSVINHENGKLHCEGHALLYDGNGYRMNKSPMDSPSYIGNGVFRCKCNVEEVLRTKSGNNNDMISHMYQIYNWDGVRLSQKKYTEIVGIEEGEVTINNCSDSLSSAYFFYKIGSEWGLLNKDAEPIYPDTQNAIEIEEYKRKFPRYASNMLHYDNNLDMQFKGKYKRMRPVGYGLFYVEIANISTGDKFVSTNSAYVDIRNHPLTPLSGSVTEIKNKLFVSRINGQGEYRQGVFDVYGNVIIPYNDSTFEIFDKFIVESKKTSGKCLYTNEGHLIVPESKLEQYDTFQLFLDSFILVSRPWSSGGTHSALFNLQGRQIYGFFGCSSYEEVYPHILRLHVHDGYRSFYYLGDLRGRILSRGYSEIEVLKHRLCRVTLNKKGVSTGCTEYGKPYTLRVPLYGVIDIYGNIVLPVLYREVSIDMDRGLIHTDKGDMTLDGRFIAKCEILDGERETQFLLSKGYNYCSQFIDGYAIACARSKAKPEKLGENDFHSIECRANEYDMPLKFGIIDQNGDEAFPAICSEIQHIVSKKYKFRINDLWGIIDAEQGIVLPPIYSCIEDFIGGVAKVSVTPMSNLEYYGLISLEEELLAPIYSVLRICDNGKVVIMARGGERGYSLSWSIFKTGSKDTVRVPGDVVFLGDAQENLIKFNIYGLSVKRNRGRIEGGKWGYMDIDGNVVIPAQYEKVYNFSEGYAAVKMNGKYGFIDRDNNTVVPFEYDSVCLMNKVISEDDFQTVQVYGYADGIGCLKKGDINYYFNAMGDLVRQSEAESLDTWDFDSSVEDIDDNPYYNDNLDMDQQSIDFWNSL